MNSSLSVGRNTADDGRLRPDKTHDSFPLFDWLRFILASVVALSHEGLFVWDRAGNLAVQIFFALSGWLIGGILLRTERTGLPRFYFNRATRIWIPYFGAIARSFSVSSEVTFPDCGEFSVASRPASRKN